MQNYAMAVNSNLDVEHVQNHLVNPLEV